MSMSRELSKNPDKTMGWGTDPVGPAYSHMWTTSQYLAGPLSTHDGAAGRARAKQGVRELGSAVRVGINPTLSGPGARAARV